MEDANVHPGTPDGFQRLWTPHRMVYIQGENKPPSTQAEVCPFCTIPDRSDRDGLIVHRAELGYVVLNLYPYSPGHLLVCPYRHVADYPDINQGAVAGAGIAAHLHQHVVPRWTGDANFLPVIGQTKALPQLLDQTWRAISDAWRGMTV